ncbi:IS66 family transposase [Limosilactobacillus galli]|uniref:IS66 family transposase n=1 Tax=Limosilactobacillus galli TaxID=2991834 RepID=UPI0024BBCF6D|nr:IS66 family transposase [Limosilactobacillus galli]
MNETIEQLKKENQALREQVAQLQAMVKLLQNQLFWKKTEVIEKVIDGQQSLFSDDELDQLQKAKTTITEVIESKKSKVVRRRKPKENGRRAAFLDHLPQVDKQIDLVDKSCPHCHQEMKVIGKRLYSREVQLKPAELYCQNLFQTSYKCPECERAGKDVIISSSMPQALIPHSYFSSSILAKAAKYKFGLALPFHRQRTLWQAVGLPVDGKQLATNMIKVSQTYLKPLYQHLQTMMSQEHVIHMDETPFKVIEEDKTNSYFWVTRTTNEFSKHQLALFNYRNTRSGQVVGELVGSDYQGLIMCDGYGGYSDRLYPSAKFGSCLVHIRREFVQIVNTIGKSNLSNSKAQQAISLLAPVFHMENQLEYQTSDEKRGECQEVCVN